MAAAKVVINHLGQTNPDSLSVAWMRSSLEAPSIDTALQLHQGCIALWWARSFSVAPPANRNQTGTKWLSDTIVMTWRKRDIICSKPHPFDRKLLYLVVFSLKQLLNIFENSACSIQVTCSTLAHWKMTKEFFQNTETSHHCKYCLCVRSSPPVKQAQQHCDQRDSFFSLSNDLCASSKFSSIMLHQPDTKTNRPKQNESHEGLCLYNTSNLMKKHVPISQRHTCWISLWSDASSSASWKQAKALLIWHYGQRREHTNQQVTGIMLDTHYMHVLNELDQIAICKDYKSYAQLPALCIPLASEHVL